MTYNGAKFQKIKSLIYVSRGSLDCVEIWCHGAIYASVEIAKLLNLYAGALWDS